MHEQDAVSDDLADDDDIEEELVSGCRELSFGFATLDHLRGPSPLTGDAST